MKKEKKKEKKRKEKEEKRANQKEKDREMEKAEFEKSLGDEYYDFKSEHCLMPLIPSSNSYNRNFVLSMGHTGVKFIIDTIGRNVADIYNVSKAREQILKRQEREGPVILNPDIKALAHRDGMKGLNAACKLFDSNRQEDKDKEKMKKNLPTVSSETPK